MMILCRCWDTSDTSHCLSTEPPLQKYPWANLPPELQVGTALRYPKQSLSGELCKGMAPAGTPSRNGSMTLLNHPMKLPLIKGCCYDDRIGWSGHPVFSFLSPTIRDWFQELQNQRSWWIWWKKKTGRCTWRAFWSKAIEFMFLCYLRSCFISFHVD